MVRQLVGSGPRAVTPTYDADESTDNIALDPELASIAQRVRSEALRGDTPEVDLGGPEEVKLKVVWKPHPLDPDGREVSWDTTQKRVCVIRFCFRQQLTLHCKHSIPTFPSCLTR